jgi:phage-related minor tail protein
VGELPLNGGVMESPSLSAYSGKNYDTPQVFAFANGGVPRGGVFGEAVPEVIML